MAYFLIYKAMKFLIYTLLFCANFAFSQITLFPYGSNWKYLDDGSNQGTAWYGTAFNDASWQTGPSEFGYGDGDEATVVNACGVVTQFPSCSNKYITTYFRKTINLTSTSSYTAYTFELRRDDGIVMYVNGNEVYRNNMPTGTINFNTGASTAASDDGATVLTFTLSASTFTVGDNVIATEIHQNNGSSSDLTFECRLIGNTNFVVPAIVKGPYLQVGTQNSMIVRWESNVATDSKVEYGTSASALSFTTTDAASITSHEIQLTGLSPYTKYYYSIGSTTYLMQGDTNNYFLTSPIPGTPGKYRFWMVGDCGNASTNQTNCKNQFKSYNANRVVNGMLLSGDNAYSSGTNSEFNTKFFNIYQNDVLKNMPLWPAPGNHDYNNGASTATTVPYYSIFTTPTNAEAGGVASGTKAYYSFDYGNIHFISLDSYGTVASKKMYDTTGAQAVWLKQDLAANTKPWVIAYWHHPPYTMGSHNSDSESDLVAIRTNFIRILERNGVDMIITGHSHDYERSKLMNGHYGNEASFNGSTHHLNSSSAKYDGSTNSCPYEKDSVVKKIGTVYVVSGSAGQLGGTQGSFPHASSYYSNATNGGTFILDIEDNRLDAKWLCADGVIRDQFTIVKEVKKVETYTVLPNQTTTLTASWPGDYVWSNSAITRTTVATATSNTTFWVKDPNNCVADSFTFKVLPQSDFNPANPLCEGNAITFNDASTNNPVSWLWSVTPSNSVNISSATAQNPVITFSLAGTYTVSLTTDNVYGTGIPVSKTITIHPNPTVTAISSSSAICIGQTATITAAGASTYTWNTGANGTDVAVTPTANVSYTVIGTDINGCENTSIESVMVNQLPIVTATSNPASGIVCAGQTITLSGSGANSYLWTGGITDGIAFTPTTSSTYTVTGTDINACQNKSVISITVNSLPVITPTSVPVSAKVCKGEMVTLLSFGAITYTWSGGVIGGVGFTPSVTSTYSVTGTGSNGCNNTALITITVNPLPNVNATSSSSLICAGQSVTLTANGASSYTWSIGQSGTSVVDFPGSITTYSVIGTATNGCTNSALITQNVSVCLGLENITKENSIKVFPNPNNGSFNIEINIPGEFNIEFFNTLGQVVYKENLNYGLNKINLEVKSGVYYYTILNNKTIVKQNKLFID